MTAERGTIANQQLTFRPRGWDLYNIDGEHIGFVFRMNDTDDHLCHLNATDSAACVSGKGQSREQAVARAFEQRAAFGAAVMALVEGAHETEEQG